jgi:proliferating cell nuclear antigen
MLEEDLWYSSNSKRNKLKKSENRKEETTMFEITMKDLKTVKGIFEALSAVITEAKMKFNKDGVFLEAIDDGRICLVGLKLDKDDFDSYKCDGEYVLGLNFDDLTKVMKRGNAKEAVTFAYNPDLKTIKILFKAEESKKSRKFGLGLIDLGDSGIKPEALEAIAYGSKISIPIGYLDEAIKDADIFGETLIISMNTDNLCFHTEGQIGESETVLERGDTGIQDYQCTEKAENTFALTYLKNIAKVGAIADRIELSLNSSSPMKAKFALMSSSNIRYYLAPRIDEAPEDYDEEQAKPEPEEKVKKSKAKAKKASEEDKKDDDEED